MKTCVMGSGTPHFSVLLFVYQLLQVCNAATPVFSNLGVSVDISETITVGTTVYTVEAEDSDGDTITYSFYANTADGVGKFTMDGPDLLTDSNFDYESPTTQYRLTITARATSSHSATDFLDMVIIDEDDEAPVITGNFTGTVEEEQAIGQTVPVDFQVSDVDSLTVSYSITGNDTNFRINSATGEITIGAVIDYETAESTTFMVVLQVDDPASNSASQTLTITLLDVNDNTPTFEPTVVYANVTENEAQGFSVIELSATDADATDTVSYFITGGDDGGGAEKFAIVGNELQTYSTPIDYEALSSQNFHYTLKVTATDGSTSSNATVYVTVIGVNEYIPDWGTFSPPWVDATTTFSVDENSAIGTPIVTLAATDNDEGLDGTIVFSISSIIHCKGGSTANLFHLDSVSGVLTTLSASLDRESETGCESYSLMVTVTDKGSPAQSMDRFIIVALNDVNDNAPVFQSNLYTASTPEGDKTGGVLTTVFAEDADSTSNIAYTLDPSSTPAEYVDFFAMHETIPGLITIIGAIYVDEPFEHPDTYSLIIKASDGLLSSTTLVIVTVTTSNEYTPTFDTGMVSTVNETITVGQPIGVMTATDEDLGGNDGVVTYTIVGGDPDKRFAVNPSSGEIFINAPLDFEQTPVYYLEVEGKDGGIDPGSKSSTGTMTISVLDVSDTVPTCSDTSISASFNETAIQDDHVTQVDCTDIDTMDTLSYSFDNGSDFFAIDDTGSITLVQVVDYEAGWRSFQLRVDVTDGSTTLSVFVSIAVTAVNEDTPTFPGPVNVTVNEDKAVGTTLTTLAATDTDVSPHGIVGYSISDVTNYGTDFFIIDFSDGSIILVTSLDYESLPEGSKEYVITVTAVDGGTPPKTGSGTVTINVVDVNDNSPDCQPSAHTAIVEETAAVGHEVVADFVCTDADAGATLYTIVQQIPAIGHFAMNETGTPRLVSAGILDYETIDSYLITLIVSDGMHNTSVYIDVTITDVNDGGPSFDAATYSATLSENVTLETYVANVTASDPDLITSTFGKLIYSLESGNAGDVFSIDRTSGRITVAKGLDAEEVTSYTLVVKVIEESGDNSTTVTCDVAVTDVNDNVPTCSSDMTFSVSMAEEGTAGELLFTMTCTDADVNDTLTYVMTSGNMSYFTLNDNVLQLLAPIDFDAVSSASFQITINVSDGVNVLEISGVVFVAGVNEASPEFTQEIYNVTKAENLTTGSLITMVTATDNDKGETVTYSWVTTQSDFSLNNETGKIVLSGVLDYESVSSYILLVKASDGNSVVTATVNITVTDVNDNAPIFNPATYSVTIDEAGSAGETVVIVTATDADDPATNDHGTITYSIAVGDGTMFAINGTTGVITTPGLDYETAKSYSLLVKAVDSLGAGGALSSTVAVLVTVGNVNEDTPTFSTSTYNATFVESYGLGTSLMQVDASDSDTGDDGRVYYTMADQTYFYLESSTGKIFLKDTIDFDADTSHSYSFEVVAHDSGSSPNSDTTTVSISVSDANDNTPVCSPSVFSVIFDESTTSGTTMASLNCSDADSTVNAILGYNITFVNSAPGSSIFDVDTDGVVTTTAVFNYEVATSHNILVKVADNGTTSLSTTVTVLVSVSKFNYNDPVFSGIPYNSSVSENITLHTSVYRVTAADADTGDTITFSLLTSNSYFTIDGDTGVIYSKATLDYETLSTNPITLIVLATDSGRIPSPRNATTTVTLTITNANDETPVFSPLVYTGSVSENDTVGFTVTTVTATDSDNGTLTYSIDSGNIGGVFGVESNGEILIANTTNLDYDSVATQHYKLVVLAVDGGGLTASVTVDVDVTNYNDHSPIFAPTSATVNITENAARNTMVYDVDASDDDFGEDGVIEYSIISADDGKFSIYSTTGVVLVAGDLDRETVSSYTVVVEATDHGTNPGTQTDTFTLTINIDDTNDVTPSCGSFYIANITEGSSSGTTVKQLTCSDADATATNNAISGYSITTGNEGGEFIISASGLVTTTGVQLDRETSPLYELSIDVTDSGSPPLTTTVSLRIIIDDVNDEEPAFGLPLFPFYVPEDSSPGYTVGNLTATDNDAGDNGAVTYSIISGNDVGKFGLDAVSGDITLVAALDYELDANKTYELLIHGVDQATSPSTGSTTVSITVTDVNDNTPTCSQSTYIGTVTENTQNTFVLQLLCTDEDVGSALTYTISSGNSHKRRRRATDHFSIDNSGVVTTAVALDAETIDTYALVIEVADSMNSQNVTVQISVSDQNEVAPAFNPASPYTIDLNEQEAVGYVAFDVDATDADITDVTLVYTIMNGNEDGMFVIDRASGQIKVSQTIDLETISVTFYNLTIEVSDGTLADTTYIVFNIVDVNDNAPSCDMSTYMVSLAENSTIGVTAITPNCTDADTATTLSYTINTGNTDSVFEIDNLSGVLTTRAVLDYEAVEAYSLTVDVDDQGVPNKVTVLTMNINIEPINEAAPVCSPDVYTESVVEDSAIGFQVVRVLATDTDRGSLHGSVTFSITAGNDAGNFDVDANSGWLTVAGTLDREAVDTYNLTVQARDSDAGDAGALSSEAAVVVTVTDVNDNIPSCTPSTHVVSIPENNIVNTHISMLPCADTDIPPNSDLSYAIITVNGVATNTPFAVDISGNVTAAESLDFETESSYEVIIEVSDGGATSLITQVTVHVDVTDVNEHTPVFQGTPYKVNVVETTSVGTVVFGVTATDADTANNITYSINSSSTQFEIDSNSGNVYTIADFDFDSPGTNPVDVVVYATDDGTPTRHSASTTLVVTVTQANDEVPVFSPPYYEVWVPENIAAETTIQELTATDADDVVLTYSFESGNDEGVFRVEAPGNVIIDNETSIDYDSVMQTYKLVVNAVDDASNTGTATVVVRLTNYNDNTPGLASSNSSKSISEDVTVGYTVVDVDATDADYGPDGVITYSISSGNDEGKFTVDPTNGVVTLAVELDRETTTSYVVVVDATDGGTNPGANTAQYTLAVSVVDANDVSPVCNQSIYMATVAEDHGIGVSVAQLHCSDGDDDPAGLNNNVSFHKTSGDATDDFTISATGEVTTNVAMNREVTADYTIEIEIRDGGSPVLTTALKLIITVTDINDRSPVFDTNPYYFEIDEDGNAGDTVGTVVANDADSGINGEVAYSITSGNDAGKFEIDSESGNLKLSVVIDYETDDIAYSLEVTGADRGSPVKSNTTTVVVNVNDVNDNKPSCGQATYVTYVEENDDSATVVSLGCSDVDTIGSPLSYSISAGNTDGYFNVNNSGVITTVSALDAEVKSSFELTVDVTDGTLTETVTVHVTVTDVTDEAPVFSPTVQYVTTINEEEPVDYVVFDLDATDADVTDAIISFAITNGDTGNVFAIDTVTGKITILQTIDYESITPKYFTLTVEVTDGSLTSTTNLVINIKDINDNWPTCDMQSYTASINETTMTAFTAITPTCTDEDVVASSNPVYNITGGNTANTFEMNTVTGALTTASVLDYENTSEYLLTVTVDDQGTPNKVTTVYMSIYVLPVNEYTPMFTTANYNASIMENSVVSAQVVQLTATDSDTGNMHGNITFSITAGNDEGRFTVDPSSGWITVVGDIDRETIAVYSLTVEAKDSDVNDIDALSSTASVAIYVLDENDNKPICDPDVEHAQFAEDTSSGVTMISLACSDSDVSLNSYLTFTILIVNGVAGTTPFSVDTDGIVTSAGAFDYETETVYEVEIEIRDGGGIPLSTTATMIVQITDVNEHTPLFQNTSYNVDVTESSPVGTPVFVVTATDGDTADNITYSLNPHSSLFSIDSHTGIVYTTSTLDFELNPNPIELVVYGYDTGSPTARSSSETLTVAVTDINDVSPAFQPPLYVVSISENTLPEVIVVRVTATDAEDAALTYSFLSGNEDKVFRIDSDDVIIDNATNLDYDSPVNNYRLVVQAVDSASNTGTANVIITVTNYNDNTPVLASSNSSLSIAEDVAVGYTVVDVDATDADYGLDGVITYSISSGNDEGKFTVDPTSGVVYLAVELDRETTTSYVVVVDATDGGINPESLTASYVLTVDVTDVNDVTPSCTQTLYTAAVAEDHPIGVSLAKIDCSDTDDDPDGSNNAVTSYVVTSGDPDNHFFIDTTGLVVPTLLLDREAMPSYNLLIQVSDAGTPTLSTTVTLTLSLIDVNDEDPVFSRDPYNFYVDEDSDIGSSLATVTATDTDSGDNGFIDYSIFSGDSRFIMDSASGVIKLTQHMDYETTTSYVLEVRATDRGSPTVRSGTATVTLNVNDVNDVAPTCESDVYAGSVAENANTGSVVASIVCQDQDTVSSTLTHTITAGNTANAFTVAGNGDVMTDSELDAENITVYTLDVNVTDGTFTISVVVLITVSDVNDETPDFMSSPPFSVSIPEAEDVGYTVFTLAATDADITSTTFTFAITGGNTGSVFDVDPQSGVVTLAAAIDREDGISTSFTLNVEVADGTTASANKASTTLDVTIDDVNDNSPTCNSGTYATMLNESSNVGTTAITPVCSDLDVVASPTLMYYITDGNSDNIFQIDNGTGVVTVSQPMDYETVSSYTLTVTVDDQGIPTELVTTLSMLIFVDPVNEDTPTFSSVAYNTTVSEDAGLDFDIFTASATDADRGSNHGDVTYAITAGNDVGHFTIGAVTGIVSVTSSLDRELIDNYILTIRATDAAGGAVALSSDATLEVIVEDVNDNGPSCSTNSMFAMFNENEVDVTVAGLVCSDADESTNSLLTYTIKTVNSVVSNDPFSINSSGVITSVNNFDYESVTSYTVVIEVSDGGDPSLSTTVVVVVSINDVNEFSPVFQPDTYTRNIAESTSFGTNVFVAVAIDADTADTADTVTYSISPSSADFEVDANDGIVYTTNTFDFDTGIPIITELVLYATDSGSPQLSSSVTLTLTITDVNDAIPAFTAGGYVTYVSENDETETTILQASATDIDDASLVYGIASGNDDNIFRIESPGGYIIIDNVTNLDYDTTRTYWLLVEAVDAASNTGTANVVVTVTGYNDNTPALTSSDSTVSIDEDEAVGYVVETVYATDADYGTDGDVTYSIASGNDEEMFSINETSGVVTLVDMLDRETTTSYTLLIDATDGGTNPSALSAQYTLTVNVTDANDVTPECMKTLYIASIPENSLVDTSVTMLDCYDNDDDPLGQNNAINRFNIISGDPSSQFSVSASGEVTTTNVELDMEVTSSYTLVIDVEDGGTPPLTTTVTARVTLSDVNDNVPVFGSTTYTWAVAEDTAPDTTVDSVAATDDDSTGSDVLYAIGSGNSEGKFSLDRITGDLILAGALDYEGTKLYTLIMYATDKGTPTNTGSATVSITVTDVNDVYPTCTTSLYSGSVAEDESTPTSVLTVACSDITDTVGSAIAYSITGTDFAIDSSTGEVSTNAALDVEAIDSYTLIATASDGLLTKNVTVQISVTDVNDVSPTFTPTGPYFVNVSEDIDIGTKVFDVHATDAEYSVTTFIYTITDGNAGGEFKIDMFSGVIQTQTNLDRDSPLGTSYTLSVMVADGIGADALNDTTTLVIAILDVNDNAPSCDDTIYNIEYSESTIPGTFIWSPTCSDLDVVASPTPLAYSITGGNENDTFEIHSTTGLITLKNLLDFETTYSYSLTVEVDDQGSSALTTTVTVFVDVAPVNEHQPVFVTTYSPTVSEDKQQGYQIESISATDDDDIASNHGVVRYSITDGNIAGHFSINPSSGALAVAGALNRESNASYSLTVRAEDSYTGAADALSAETTVTITVTDVNDNYPVFNPRYYIESVVESATVNATLFQVTATDDDSGSAGTAGLEYSIIAGNSDGKFGMVGDEVILTGDIDAATKSSYTLEIQARDDGSPPLSETAIMTIRVIASNEHTPVFTRINDTISLPETTEVGTSIYHITASDSDTGIFAELCYYIDSGNDDTKFDVNQFSGEVKVKNRLDFDSIPMQYVLIFRVEDTCVANGATLSATRTLTIDLTDENDEIPLFTSNSYTATVNENEAISTSVFSVTATDGDSGINADITYSILSGTGMSVFYIESDSGVGRVNGTIDREKLQTYDLLVLAEDGGTPSLSTTTAVNITVNDLNDEVPTYQVSNLAISVSESTGNGDIVKTVTATDADSSDNNNNVVTYSLSPASTYFTVHSTSGDISVTNALDRETQAIHTLTVLAVDGGTNPGTNTGTATVTVHLTDINDNPPVVTGSYDTKIAEDVDTNYFVFTIVATDADENENAFLTYEITSGDAGDYFRIDDRSGLIQVSNTLDREMVEVHTLEITVSDGGSSVNSVTVSATVTVKDANDNAPVFSTSIYTFSVLENEPAPTTVGQVSASDADTDTNGVVSYSIVSFTTGNAAHLLVDPSTGDVKTTVELDREQMDTYVFVVRATDGGTTPLSSSATVSVTVSDVDDETPHFGSSSYTANTLENQPVGTSILTVVVTDNDLAASTNITYSIESGTRAAQYIQIDPDTSVLSVKQEIDRENDESFTFDLTATDSGALTTSTLIIITVDDENDNYPVFSPSFYNTEVAYDDDCQETLATVTATDADEGVNAAFTYAFQGATPTVFSLGTSNGEVTITPDAEEDRKYVIYVTATDRGTPAQDAAADATVRIDTYNRDTVIVNYYLSIARSEFLAQESTFLAQLTTVYQGTYPAAEVKRQCVTARSSSTCIVHTYVIKNANETDDQSETGNAKVFLTADDAFSVTSADTAGTPASSISDTTDWTPFAIDRVEKYSDSSSSSEPWITTPAGIGTLCAVAALLISAIVGTAVACLKKRFRSRYSAKQLRTVHPSRANDLESDMGDYVGKNQYHPKDNLRRMFNDKNTAVSNEKFMSDKFSPVPTMPAAKRFPMQMNNSSVGDRPADKPGNPVSFFEQHQDKPNIPELKQDHRMNLFDKARPLVIGMPAMKKFPPPNLNNTLAPKQNNLDLPEHKEPEKPKKARAEDEDTPANQSSDRVNSAPSNSGSGSNRAWSDDLYSESSSRPVVVKRGFDGRAIDAKTGRMYEYNTRTNERRWVNAPDAQQARPKRSEWDP